MVELHLSIGPVQAFVSSSRRTRDLWASSHLLSFLSGQAMLGLLDASSLERLQLPNVSRAKIDELLGKAYATLPNRFVASFDDEGEARRAAAAAVERLRAAWTRCAEAVWQRYLRPVADERTREIWVRQVDNFWDIAWIVSEHPAPLALRKTWRSAPMTVEGGDHCTMMPELQELSGQLRSGRGNGQRSFWDRVRAQQVVSPLDLADDERLSAIAFIKRFYPKVAKEAVGHALDVRNWPSTAYTAAVPWIARVARDEETRRLAQLYADKVQESTHDALGEIHYERFASLRTSSGMGRFPALDGNYLRDNALEEPKSTPLLEDEACKTGEGPTVGPARAELLHRLRELYRKAGGGPSPYYAMLLMDGDSMGELMGRAASVGRVADASGALVDFAEEVPGVVDAHNGVTIYAGGDDVLALLPVVDAVRCAAALSQAYRDCFARRLRGTELASAATLSGALVFAHYRAAFSAIVADAHHLLDDVAKDATGRDSLAVALYKSSGLAIQWSAPWRHLLVEGADAEETTTLFDELDVDAFSSSFFYNIRQRIGLLTDQELPAPGAFGRLLDTFEPTNVLLADYLASVDESGPQARDRHRPQIARLLALCRRARREDGEVVVDPLSFGVDGAMLARFLLDEDRRIR